MLFGLGPPPGSAIMPGDQPMPQQPFLWGRGGRRMSPDDVDLQRRLAAQEMAEASSVAPVGHWTQGLARALGGLTGGMKMRRADKAEAQQRERSDAVTEALLANPDRETVLAALANPDLGAGGQTVAKLLAEQMFAAPAAPPDIIQLARIANDPSVPEWERQAAADAVRAKNDPFITFSGPSFGYAGPQSEFATALGGGGQTSGAGSTAQPPAEAIAELQQNPGTAAQFNEVFGPGAAERILGQGGPASAPGGFPGA